MRRPPVHRPDPAPPEAMQRDLRPVRPRGWSLPGQLVPSSHPHHTKETIMSPHRSTPTTTRKALLAATALGGGLLATGPALAQADWRSMPTEGLYIGAAVGPNWRDITKLDQSGSVTTRLRENGFPAANGKAKFDVGIAGNLALGWGFGNGLRAELEGGYHGNNVRRITGFGALGQTNAAANPNGTGNTPSVMVNAYYDFYIPGTPWIVPYIGAGIGAAWSEISRETITYNNPAFVRPGRLTVGGNSSSTSFAYQ